MLFLIFVIQVELGRSFFRFYIFFLKKTSPIRFYLSEMVLLITRKKNWKTLFYFSFDLFFFFANYILFYSIFSPEEKKTKTFLMWMSVCLSSLGFKQRTSCATQTSFKSVAKLTLHWITKFIPLIVSSMQIAHMNVCSLRLNLCFLQESQSNTSTYIFAH